MPDTKSNASFEAMRRRHPRLLNVISWLRAHPVLCGTAGAIGIAAVFVVDMSVTGYLMSGVYVIPLFFLALAVNWRAVAFAGAMCIALSAFVFVWEDSLSADRWLILLYAFMIGAVLVVLSYLIGRLSTLTGYAELRAQLSEAGADILGSGRTGDDLDELLEYALERLGEQLSATSGVLLLLENGEWTGRAGFGLGVDARQVVAQYPEVPLAAQALRTDAAVARDFTDGDPAPVAPLAAHVQLERVLVLPMRSLEREVGVLVYNRPAGRGRVQPRAGRARRGPRPLHRRDGRQRAPHVRARARAVATSSSCATPASTSRRASTWRRCSRRSSRGSSASSTCTPATSSRWTSRRASCATS